MKRIILASTSPRRRDLLKQAGFDFEIIAPEYDENILNKSFDYNLIENIAKNKGLSAAKKVKEPSIIISADTVVVYNNIVMGKPKDFDTALRMLSMLNNNTHIVVTSVCAIDVEKQKQIIKSETSEVTFNDISKKDLTDYIYKFQPYDKAGSYGIQELPDFFIKEIKGDYNNIVGLPVKLLINIIEEINNA